MKKVEVSGGLLIGLICALGAALLGLVFLLGRESARPAPAAPPQPAAQAPPPTQSTQPAPEAPAPTFAVQPPPAPMPGPAPAPATPPMDPAHRPPDTERAAVAAYFQAVDHIQPGELDGDPQSVAQGMVEELGKGDSSGLDGMVRQAESARSRLAALAPPPACAAYHRESLADLDASLELLRGMKQALSASDADALSSLNSKATALRARSEALQREEQQLRQRYGLGSR